ncbi:hypothetical protein PHYSODRAFT_305662 [Phytophthora sojae]|uniref:Uncharacterized protein n=1 Tax=Phytophthora sojae (strain P6497) TaxID=1094619 RepID=G5A5Z9_PHYSP|nr:hypothetical protein PHYSODRAFT_305662 [Phytophthora sojae]EGZ08754.1 hypothetical protein PHYSODRAFT_305662 [Phytophthora sojae]|eukprot:XP_009535387.1 hypothetical protein PHYSODRAFT_305662 [Phytophthora sojae]
MTVQMRLQLAARALVLALLNVAPKFAPHLKPLTIDSFVNIGQLHAAIHTLMLALIRLVPLLAMIEHAGVGRQSLQRGAEGLRLPPLPSSSPRWHGHHELLRLLNLSLLC